MGEEEFRRLYDILASRIYAFALARLRADSAKDVVADTFETVWRKIADAPAEPEARTSWIFRIARFKVMQEQQRVRRKHHDNRFAADYELAPAREPDAADVVADREMGGQIYLGLRPREQELFDVLFLVGMTKMQACEFLEISPGALDTRLSRLRDRITALEVAHTTQPEERHRG